MLELDGKVAVVTGGGSGIGRGIALALAESGAHTVLADIDSEAAEVVAFEARSRGVEALPVRTDVTDAASVAALAKTAYDHFGAVHVLCNNAGVTTFGMLGAPGGVTDEDWRWILGVNLEGVVNGLQAFLPRMYAQDGEKHVVNTASIAGVVPHVGIAPYVASKYAVVGLSESLRVEGAGYSLSCTVVCPGNVRTRIAESTRNRPASLGGHDTDTPPILTMVTEAGIDPLFVGAAVRQAILDDDMYVFTHPEQRHMVEGRFAAISAAFDRADARSNDEARRTGGE